jgi:hypothetical protein
VIDTKERGQLLTAQEVKYILQIGYERIIDLVRTGELEGYALEGGTKALRITPESLEEYLEARKIR